MDFKFVWERSFNTKTRLQGQRGSLVFVLKLISTFIGPKSKILFYDCVEEGCSAFLPIAREKQT
jgi:hypothetical protein